MADEQRPMRMCDACGQVDDHPRHVFAYADGDGATDPKIAAAAIKAAGAANVEAIVAQVQDNTTIMRHMDCCRAAGCPDGACGYVTAGAEDKQGDALVKHLTAQPGRMLGAHEIEGGGVVPEGRNADPDEAAALAAQSEGN